VNRPTYQSEVDRAIQWEIASFICMEWGCEAEEFPPFHPLDFRFWKQSTPCGLAEVKDRSERQMRGLSFGYGDGYYLSRHKALHGMRNAFGMKLPCLLIVRFHTDLIYYAMLDSYMKGMLVMFGRTDRHDNKDIEPCVVYPWENFTLVPWKH
jgi:hypothetical protein